MVTIPGSGDFVLYIASLGGVQDGRGVQQATVTPTVGTFAHILSAYAGVRAAARAWPEYADDRVLTERRFGFIPVEVGRGKDLIEDARYFGYIEVGAAVGLATLVIGALVGAVRWWRR